MARPLGLIRKNPPAASGTPTTPAAAPRLPSQGHTQDDDEGNIPPPPAMPNGTYLCRVKNIYHPIDKETGKWQTWDDGSRKQSKVFFVIDDPDEQRKATAGKENCYGADLDIKLDFGSFYNQTLGYLTALGCPQIGWPTKISAKTGKPATDNIMLGEHIMAQTKGKKFAVTVKPEAGKGDKKTTLYKNVKKVAPYTPPKAPPKAAAPIAPAQDPDDTAAEEPTGADPDTSTTSNAESDEIPF